MRGNRAGKLSFSLSIGSIPAYAGEPYEYQGNGNGGEVYPRVCGGTTVGGAAVRHVKRSIPAYAGEPRLNRCAITAGSVYPRVCGGTPGALLTVAPAHGLSPRMRGNRSVLCGMVAGAGSIPAYAGEPPRHRRRHPTPTVYPRVCGGTRTICKAMPQRMGLSPRMRGNRRR